MRGVRLRAVAVPHKPFERVCRRTSLFKVFVSRRRADTRVLWRTYAVRACRVANGDGRDTESRIHDRYGRCGGSGTQHGTRAYKLSINPPPRYALA